ncbi:MAG: sensor histidine kinase, partial [Opitutaceae bacterium]|nr:sensor histidine kinase [Opitutaceae bacterium]
GAIRLQFRDVPAAANGDESVVRHIFTNLLSNALKYSPLDQPVDFVVRLEGAQAAFAVIDRGCGIPEGDRRRLFQAFHRGSNVRQIPGTGLGLLIVRRCVELHGGHLTFESVEGQGTTFTVSLPLFATGVAGV